MIYSGGDVKHFNVLGILFLTIFLWNGSAVADDQITCTQEINNNVEIFALFATVKNDILGTLPQFCRPEGYKQLSDQIDPGEKALSDFVDNLKSFNANTPDTVAVNTKDEKETTKTIFDMLKMVILKKMWQQSSSENQYSILVSQECGSLGLNRFPIYGTTKQSEKIKEKNKEEALKKTYGVCQSSEFSEIAPFISKDVLAETLLNLKNVFPHSFPHMVDSLCADLSETDELIFKDDKYNDFSRGKLTIDSAKDFTAWLKSIYKDVSNKEENDKKEMEASKVIQEAEEKAYAAQMAQFEEESKNNKSSEEEQYNEEEDEASVQESYAKEQQKMLKGLFDKYSTGGKPGLIKGESGDYAFYNGYEIKKTSSGEYVIKPGADLIAAQKAQIEESKKQQKIMMDGYAKKLIASKKMSMQATYEAAQAKAPGKPVEDPANKGFYIEKDSNGNYYYRPTAEMIAAVAKQKQVLEEQLKSPESQEYYKQMYEHQKKPKDEEDGAGYGYGYSSGYSGSKIIINKDGFYVPELSSENYQSESNKKISAALTKSGASEIAPGPTPGSAIFLNPSGSYVSETLLQSEDMLAAYADGGYSSNTVKYKDVSIGLNSYITKKYQGQTSDNSKIKQLTSDEILQLKSYTGNGYHDINTCLRKEDCSEEQTKKIKAIVSGLQKIKSENWKKGIENTSPNNYQIVYRGTRDLPDFVQKALDKESDSFVLDKGFMSTTGEVNTAKKFAGGKIKAGSDQAIFIMKTKSCVGISTISSFGSAEDEFLCPPGMKFRARQKKDSPGYYILEELDK